MYARPATIVANVNPSESIHHKTQTHLTPLESHSCNITQYKIFRITFLRKNRGGVVILLTTFPKWNPRLLSLYRYLVTSLLLYFSPYRCFAPRTLFTLSSSRYFVTSLLLYFASPSYTHSLSLHPRSYKC
jgi:hypothetical protein